MYEQVFTSELFTFVLGQEGQQIVVHSEAISQLSPALTSLISGRLRESQEKVVRWDDLEPGDFIRLCQFAYTGDYSPPSPVEPENISDDRTHFEGDAPSDDVPEPPELPEPPPPPELEPEPEAYDTWGVLSSVSKKKKKKKGWDEDYPFKASKADKLRISFCSKVFPKGDRDTLSEPVANVHPEQDFTPVLLAHARLYVLGNKYDIVNLTSIALYKLHKTLKLFSVSENRINDIIELVGYAYENTPESSNDALRSLVTEYIVMEIDIIGKSPKFWSLLEEGGEFVVDFWKVAQEYLL